MTEFARGPGEIKTAARGTNSSKRPVVAVYDTGLGRGGARHSLFAWIQILRASGRYEVCICASGEGWLVEKLNAHAIPWRRLPMPAALGRIKHGTWKNPLLTAGRVLSMAAGLPAAWIRALFIRADVCLLTGGRDFIVLFPLVMRMRNHVATIPQTTDWGRIPTCRWMCQLAAETWAISRAVGNSIAEMGIPESKIRVMPLIFTRERPDIDGSMVRREAGIPSDALVLGLAGVIRKQKGQMEAMDIFAEVARRVPSAHLVFVGEAQADQADAVRYERSLREKVAASGLAGRVHFTGWCGDVPRLMRAFDVLLVPSLDNEGVPRVILEGLEAGLPIVGSDLPQFEEILTMQEAGCLFALADRAAWVDCLTSLLLNVDRRERESARSRAAWERCYSEQVAAPALLEAVERLRNQ